MGKKTKLLIKQIDDAYNYGNAMLGMVFIDALNQKFGETIDITTDIQADEYIEYYKKNIGITLKKDSWIEKENHSKSRTIRILAKIFNSIKNSIHLNNYDHVIYLGGDYFTQYYGWGNMLYKMCNLLLTKKHKLIMLGQTIGNFSPAFKLTASILFKNIMLYTRDDISFEYATKKLKMKNVYASRDLAFSSLPNQKEFKQTEFINRLNLKSNNYVTVVLTGLVEKYTSDENSFYKSWIKILETLVLQHNEYIVILAHVVTTKKSSDLPTVQKIANKIETNDILKNKVQIVDKLLMPIEARTILGNGKYSISCRMHAAISTYEMNKPAIALSYSIKYAGVIGNGLNLPELVIEQKEKDLWQSGEIVHEILDKCKYVNNNYDMLIQRIENATELAQEAANNQLSDIIKLISDENTL